MPKSLSCNSTPTPNQNSQRNRTGWILPWHKHIHLDPKANTTGPPAGLRNKARMPTISTTMNMLLEIPAYAIRQEKIIKRSSSVRAGARSYSLL